MTIPPTATVFSVIAAAASVGSAQAPCSLVLDDISLERCLQRCQDAMRECTSVAYDSSAYRCAIGVQDAADCSGSNWAVHTRNFACNYGYGRVSTAVPCGACPKGTASHATVGDLTGMWSLQTASGTDAGRLEIDGAGFAVFKKTGLSGQFTLWHSRSDENYPGAYYFEHGASWDYAWLQDEGNAVVGGVGPRLVIRRFCGIGPLACATAATASGASGVSPEGSMLYDTTLTGRRISGAEMPCALLDGSSFVPSNSAATAAPGQCCDAATEVADGQATVPTEDVASISVDSTPLSIPRGLPAATWNANGVVGRLRNLVILANGTDRTLCSPINATGSNVVLFAMRGGCQFVDKAVNAEAAGAKALIIGNDNRTMPDFLKLPEGYAGSAPGIPAWLLDTASARALENALLNSGQTRQATLVAIGATAANDADLQDLCCASSCKSRASAAKAAGRAAGLDLDRVCSYADCSAYSSAPPAPAPPLLPGGGEFGAPCGSCPHGRVAAMQGQASCTSCSGGHAPSEEQSSCVACGRTSISDGQQCVACAAGYIADVAGTTCVRGTTGPGPTPPPTTPPPTPPSVTLRPDYTLQDGQGVYVQDEGFPWGTLLGFFIVFCSCCGCGALARRWYQTHDVQHMWDQFRGAEGGGGIGRRSNDDDEEAGSGDGDDKKKDTKTVKEKAGGSEGNKSSSESAREKPSRGGNAAGGKQVKLGPISINYT